MQHVTQRWLISCLMGKKPQNNHLKEPTKITCDMLFVEGGVGIKSEWLTLHRVVCLVRQWKLGFPELRLE